MDDKRNAVTLLVFVATPELQQRLDDEHGQGTVLLEGWLRPIS